jgi:AmmeMemoRadiSam system protein B
MAFSTPLGEVPVDADLRDRMVGRFPEVEVSDRAHDLEHSLEVELPFLQVLLDDFRVLPVVVGEASAEAVADVLEYAWGGDETRVVVSSDLSHYLPYDDARRVDRESAKRILGLEPRLDHGRACGATPINGLLVVARRKKMIAEMLELMSSGDTAGDRSRVVGYGAFAFFPHA